MLSLRELVAAVPDAMLRGGDVTIKAVRYDSRQVQPGDLFVAIAGARADGHHYLRQALSAGAAALAVEAGRRDAWQELEGRCPLAILPDTRKGLSPLAAAFYAFPARRLKVIGITGTDGKTSLAHLTAHLLKTAGLQAGNISTIGCEIAGIPLLEFDSRFTTPEAPEVHAMLARMVESGCSHAVVESTSHGLALHRLDDCEYDIAAVTNVGA
ncbi:MAG TPA: Mur ligase family protein, partial [Dehalococcoidia bacterium]|nr:Mur ligase family protein [Dehalococcoidia bacterium]